MQLVLLDESIESFIRQHIPRCDVLLLFEIRIA